MTGMKAIVWKKVNPTQRTRGRGLVGSLFLLLRSLVNLSCPAKAMVNTSDQPEKRKRGRPRKIVAEDLDEYLEPAAQKLVKVKVEKGSSKGTS